MSVFAIYFCGTINATYLAMQTIIPPYTSDITLNLVLEKLESSIHGLFRWHKENHMKANPEKCHSENLRKHKWLPTNKQHRGKITRY